MRARPFRCVVFFAIFTIWTLLPRPTLAADPTSQPTPGLDLLVTDPDGKPLSGAQVTANIDGKATKSITQADGHVQIPPPKSATAPFTVSAHVDGLVDMSADWRNRRADPIPPTYTIKLEAGTTIRGKVVDNAGKPIAGATVELWISKQLASGRQRSSRQTSVMTGADGAWSLNGVPADGASVRAGAWDYQYANGNYYPMVQPSAAELRDGSFTITLNRGIEIDCVILKADGTPLPGARVATGSDLASNKVPPQKADKDGKVVYFAKPGEQVVITVTAGGFATDMTQFVMGSEKHDMSMKMQPSVPLTGQVLDPDGKPVPNAWIYPDTWRGFRSLDARIHADRNGKFTWKDAPLDEVLCDVDATASGFARQQNVPMTAGDQPNIVTVQRALRVSGTVVDAETNQPIESFRIIRGISFGDEQATSWQRQPQPEMGRGGKFQFIETFPYPGYAVRIEADGYTPAESRVFTADEKQVALELKLNKGQSLIAVILTPDGKPAAGAKVALIEPGQNAQIANDGNTFIGQSAQVTAGPDGHCSFPAEAGSFKIVAMDTSGYVEVNSAELPKTGEIRLLAWGRVQGKVMIGHKPAAAQKIILQVMNQTRYDPKEPRIFHSFQATTDADGAFTIERVPAGGASVGREIETSHGQLRTITMTEMEQIEVAAGQTTNITIGGKGRPVEGSVVIPPSLANRPDGSWNLTGSARTSQSVVPIPDNIKHGTREEQQKSSRDFLATDAGKPFMATQQAQIRKMRYYPVQFDADGKFHIDDVTPGPYQLTFNIVQNVANNTRITAENDVLAEGNSEFTVAEIPGGQTDDTLKLPPIPMTLLPHVAVGDAAPDFTAKTADGKDVKLSDFKGKYVLVDFFFPMATGTRADQAILSSVADTFGGESRLSMIGVNLNGPPETTKSYGQPNGLTWTAASLQKSEIITTYGLRSVVSIWLIGPDGKVLGKNLTADTVKSSLNTALGPQGL